MSVEMIQTIGQFIVIPICALLALIAWLYFLTK